MTQHAYRHIPSNEIYVSLHCFDDLKQLTPDFVPADWEEIQLTKEQTESNMFLDNLK